MGFFGESLIEGILFEVPPTTAEGSSDNQGLNPTATLGAEPANPQSNESDAANVAVEEAAAPEEAEQGASEDDGEDAPEEDGEDDTDEEDGNISEDAAPETTPKSDDAARREFEEEEAKRKADWEAKQLAKLQMEADTVQRVGAMNSEERSIAAAERLSKEFELFSRMELKSYLTQQIQMKCYEDPELAKAALHPRKSFGNCLRYVNRRAYEYFTQERKDTGEVPCDGNPAQGIYCAAIDSELCTQWAEDYYRDPFAKEDLSKDEEYKPAAYHSTNRVRGKSGKKKPAEKKAAENKTDLPKPPKRPAADDGQMTFFEAG